MGRTAAQQGMLQALQAQMHVIGQLKSCAVKPAERSEKDLANITEILLGDKVISALPPCRVKEVAGLVRLTEHSAGDVIFRQGDTGDAFYIIMQGSVEVEVQEGGLNVFSIVLESGTSFGGSSVIAFVAQPRPRSCQPAR